MNGGLRIVARKVLPGKSCMNGGRKDRWQKGSWWQEVFFASQDEANSLLEDIELPGKNPEYC